LLVFNLPVVLVNGPLVVVLLLVRLNFVFLWVVHLPTLEPLKQLQPLVDPVELTLTLVSNHGNFVCRFPLR
jgi:hypothetical protein